MKACSICGKKISGSAKKGVEVLCAPCMVWGITTAIQVKG